MLRGGDQHQPFQVVHGGPALGSGSVASGILSLKIKVNTTIKQLLDALGQGQLICQYLAGNTRPDTGYQHPAGRRFFQQLQTRLYACAAACGNHNTGIRPGLRCLAGRLGWRQGQGKMLQSGQPATQQQPGRNCQPEKTAPLRYFGIRHYHRASLDQNRQNDLASNRLPAYSIGQIG